jgi:integrase
MAAITDPTEVGKLLVAMDGYHGSSVVRAAMKLSPLLFVRPGELRTMEWAHIDFVACEWRYTVSKTRTQHIVPLCSQALAVLRELEPLMGRGKYVFPSGRGVQAVPCPITRSERLCDRSATPTSK